MTGCHKDIPQHQALSLIMRPTTVDEQTKKIMTELNISHLVQSLGATVTHQTVIDSSGRKANRIIITYNETHR